MSIKRTFLMTVLAVLVSVGIVEAPAAFAAVSGVTFTTTNPVGLTAADWTVKFVPSNGGNGELKAGDRITVTFNPAFAVPSSPSVTLVGGFTGNCTATSSASGTNNTVVAITLAGTTCGLKNATATLLIAGITNPVAGSYSANSFTVATTKDSAASPATSVLITGGKLAFIQGPPPNGSAGTALAPAITVQVQDANGNPATASGIAIALTASAGVIDSGDTATTNSAGRATFSGVTINTAALGLTLSASASGLASAGPSSVFNVTVVISNGAVLTDTAVDGSGSGVQGVAYYYCAGLTGSCTSSNWTSIASSTSAATNYRVTWSGQPANGSYRLVAVSTDNVTNVSQPSSSIPVTITN